MVEADQHTKILLLPVEEIYAVLPSFLHQILTSHHLPHLLLLHITVAEVIVEGIIQDALTPVFGAMEDYHSEEEPRMIALGLYLLIELLL